jgi:hypothetical protein
VKYTYKCGTADHLKFCELLCVNCMNTRVSPACRSRDSTRFVRIFMTSEEKYIELLKNSICKKRFCFECFITRVNHWVFVPEDWGE